VIEYTFDVFALSLEGTCNMYENNTSPFFRPPTTENPTSAIAFQFNPD
jgi:hypothetical protein